MSFGNKGTSCGIETITIIAAMTADRVIGKDGNMPWHISAELKNFKKLTMGKPMIMGRTTFDSLGRKALPGRDSIVLSSSKIEMPDNCHLASDLESALSIAEPINNNEVMVVGGATVYEQFLPIANKMLITYVNENYPGDTFFPEFSNDEWKIISEEEFEEFRVAEMQRVGS